MVRIRPRQTIGTATLATIRAPFDGVITAYDVAVGEIVEPERALVTIANLETVWILADVYEKDLARVPSAADVDVRVDAYPDKVFKGKLTYVSDVIDPKSRSAKVRSVVHNPDGLLRLDMFARVRFRRKTNSNRWPSRSTRSNRLTARRPCSSANRRRGFAARTYNWVCRPATLIEVKAGLKAGETIVAAGSFYFKTCVAARVDRRRALDMDRLIDLSLRYKFLVLVLTVVVIGAGINSMLRLPIDAVPDVTPNQVLILTSAPGLGRSRWSGPSRSRSKPA